MSCRLDVLRTSFETIVAVTKLKFCTSKAAKVKLGKKDIAFFGFLAVLYETGATRILKRDLAAQQSLLYFFLLQWLASIIMWGALKQDFSEFVSVRTNNVFCRREKSCFVCRSNVCHIFSTFAV